MSDAQMENDESWKLMPTFRRRMERAEVEKKNIKKTRKKKRSLEIENNDPKKEEKINFDLRIETPIIKNTRKRKSSAATVECFTNPSLVSTSTAPMLLCPPTRNADVPTEAPEVTGASHVAFTVPLPLCPPAANADARTEAPEDAGTSLVGSTTPLPLAPPAANAAVRTEALDASGTSHVTSTAPLPLSPPAENADVRTEAPDAARTSHVASTAPLLLSPPTANAAVHTEISEAAGTSHVAFTAPLPLSPLAENADVRTEAPDASRTSHVASTAPLPLSPPAANAAVHTETFDAAGTSHVAFTVQLPLSPPAENADVRTEAPDASRTSHVASTAPLPLSPPAANPAVHTETSDAAGTSHVAFTASLPLSPPAENAVVRTKAPDASRPSHVASTAPLPLSPPAVNGEVLPETPNTIAATHVTAAALVPLSPPARNADFLKEASAAPVLLPPPVANADVPTEIPDVTGSLHIASAGPVPLPSLTVNADSPTKMTDVLTQIPDVDGDVLNNFAALVPSSLPAVNNKFPTNMTDADASIALVPLFPPAASADALKETASTAYDQYIALSTTFESQANISPFPLQGSRTSRQSPLPSTSNSNIIEQVILDLQLSDSNDSPYVDSESSYHPEKNKSSTTSDTSRDENEETNVRKRSKKANPDTWKRNIAKNKRQSGQSYINRKGDIVSAKNCVPTNCSKCRYKCNDNFTENVRADLCRNFWGLGESKHQKIYLSTLITHANIQRKTVLATKQRAMSRQYFLCHKNTGRQRVCQKFFCNTFNISTSVIDTCTKQMGQNCVYVGDDQRKGLIPGNKTSEEAKNYVKLHIDMFPRIESHYCRKDSKKKYLESDLNMARLYKLYKEEFCLEKNITPVSLYVYEQIFKSYDPPLAFYKPKKDQCTKCNVYKYAEDKTNLQRDYDEHKAREKESLEMKAFDKKESIEGDGTKRAITFDLQAILSVPHTADSKIYYLRKFSIYNFTILDNYQNTGLCYMWDESNGKKGSTEIGSILLKYLMDLPENVKTVTSFSDTCSGQNRNKYVTLAALYAVINVPHLKIVNLKYMESGHSYLEADSIHASIERARKHKKIFTAREYALVVSSARSKPKPYDVIVMKYPESLNSNMVKNKNNEQVKWMNIKWIQVRKESPGSVFYKYKLSDTTFKEIDIAASKKKMKKGSGISHLYKPLKKAYKSQIPISKAKKKDLMTLLKDGVIPQDYVDYYTNIPSIDEENIINDCSDSESDD